MIFISRNQQRRILNSVSSFDQLLEMFSAKLRYCGPYSFLFVKMPHYDTTSDSLYDAYWVTLLYLSNATGEFKFSTPWLSLGYPKSLYNIANILLPAVIDDIQLFDYARADLASLADTDTYLLGVSFKEYIDKNISQLVEALDKAEFRSFKDCLDTNQYCRSVPFTRDDMRAYSLATVEKGYNSFSVKGEDFENQFVLILKSDGYLHISDESTAIPILFEGSRFPKQVYVYSRGRLTARLFEGDLLGSLFLVKRDDLVLNEEKGFYEYTGKVRNITSLLPSNL